MTAAHLFLCLSLPCLPPDPVPYPCPELAALSWFPPVEEAARQRAFCQDMVTALKGRALWDESAWPALCYANWCEDVWDDLCRAYNETTWDNTRVGDLERLRGKIGDHAFAAGRMPSPLWACQVIQ